MPVRLIMLSLVFGLTYVFLIPPWQHYDEPGHFEYVWLIANRSGWPRAGDYDPAMRRKMLLSMEKYNFPRYLNVTIDPNAKDPSIGYSQVGDLPVYYWFAALPLYFLKSSNITYQLYASRLVSLIMYVVIIFIAWGITAEMTSAKSRLRWIVPITLILLPGFTDLMTAVNSDVGAVMAFSLFLWLSVRLLRQRPSIFNILSVIGATVLCCFMKNNIWLALPMLPMVLLFSWLRGRWRPLAWALCLGVIGIIFSATFSWGDAALWYRRTFQNVSTRVANLQAPLGGYAFRLDLSQQESGTSIVQPLTPKTVVELRNEPITFGGWAWSDRPMPAQLQLTYESGGELRTFSSEILVDYEPKFYITSATVPVNARHFSAGMFISKGQTNEQGSIFFDGLVLVKGNRSSQVPPVFEDVNGGGGQWAGVQFTNLLRNPSAEHAGPSIRTWANKILNNVLPPFPAIFSSDIPMSLLDWEGAGWYYKGTGTAILRTFWAKFGWGNVPLLGSKPYRALAVVSALGLVGAVWAIWQRRSILPWEILLILVIGFLGVWIQVLVRGLGSMFGPTFIPYARYGAPAILPTILILCVGWLEILRMLGQWLHVGTKVQSMVYLLCFAGLDVLSFLSITNYYYAGKL
jgi:hypothetical protein